MTCHFWLLGSAMPAPLVVLANASEGQWVHELVPTIPPVPPIQFFLVREGIFSPFLHPAGLVLFRDDLIAALVRLSLADFAAYGATIRPPQSGKTIENYQVIKMWNTIPLASLTTVQAHPGIFVVQERIDVVVVTDELRRLLTDTNIPGLRFYEPVFFGPPSGNII